MEGGCGGDERVGAGGYWKVKGEGGDGGEVEVEVCLRLGGDASMSVHGIDLFMQALQTVSYDITNSWIPGNYSLPLGIP